MASIFCDVEVPDYIQELCGSELGGIVAIALIEVEAAAASVLVTRTLFTLVSILFYVLKS